MKHSPGGEQRIYYWIFSISESNYWGKFKVWVAKKMLRKYMMGRPKGISVIMKRGVEDE